MLLTCSIISLILLVWFRTEAWLEYCRLFGLDCISFYKDFEVKQYNDVTLTYHIYLRRYHNSFFVRLITCPICLSVWLALTITIIKGTLLAIGIIILTHGGIGVILLTLLGMAFELPVIILGSLAIYGAIDRLLG